MPADRAGGGTRRIEQHVADRPGRSPGERIGHLDPGLELEALEIAAQAAGPPVRQLDRGHCGARRGQLRGLAAGRRAQIDHSAPAYVAEQPRRQRRGGILDPPGALGVARQLLDRAARRAPHRIAVQSLAAEPRRPVLGIGLHGEIERRLGEMGLGDRHARPARRTPPPALPEPVRRVQPGRVLARQILLAFARDPPQHGVDQALGEGVRAAGQRHGLGHRGVRRGVEEQELRGAEPEQVVHADGLGARTHEPVEQSVDLAEPAQHGGDQQAGERPVPRVEKGKRRVPGERLVQRARLAQHPVEHVQRDQARAHRAGHGRGLRRPTGRAARRAAPGGSARWSPPARRTPRTSRSAGPRSGRAGSRTAP